MTKLLRLILVLAALSIASTPSALANTIYSSQNTDSFGYTTITGSFVGTGVDTLVFATYQLPSYYLLDNIVIPGVDLINPSFEDGNFTGYTQTGDISYTGVTGVFGGTEPPDGSYQGYFGQVNSSGFLAQTFYDTPGETYDISFEVADLSGGPSAFCAYIDTPSTTCPTPGDLPPAPPPPSVTPEPSSLVLLGSGILSVAGAARRKFRKA